MAGEPNQTDRSGQPDHDDRETLRREIGRLQLIINDLRLHGKMVAEDAQKEIIRLRDLLYVRELKIRHMQNTFSWKATAPLRALRRLLIDGERKVAGPTKIPPENLPKILFDHSASDFEDSPRFCQNIDAPGAWSGLRGDLKVVGWCFARDRTAIAGIRALIGDRKYEGRCNLSRPDIALKYPAISQAERSGFEIDLTVKHGDYRIVIEARLETGVWHRVLIRSLGCPRYDYQRWLQAFDTYQPVEYERLRDASRQLARRPRISIILPVYNTPAQLLECAVASVLEQVYDNWELCIADDASPLPHVRPMLEGFVRRDSRIKVAYRTTNGHISEASNSALALATGEFVALLDHDDELVPHSLAAVAFELNSHPAANLIYTDEDKLDGNGQRFGPYFKPDWNPDLLLAQNFICHLAVYRTSLVRELGGFRVGFEGSQDWDLALRVTERSSSEQIRHIPHVLYRWRAVEGSTAHEVSEKNYSVKAAERLLREHLARTQTKAKLSPTCGHYWRVQYELPAPAPRVSLLIPTRNRLDLLRRCVETIRTKTAYPDYEIVVLDNESDDPATLSYLDQLRGTPGCRVLRFPGPFNFSAINNFGVQQTDAPVVGLLNNDLEAIHADWLEELVSQALRPGIGCVGAKLFYPDGRIQHAGLILGIGGMAGHSWHGMPGDTTGPGHRACLQQNLSAVTAACLVVRRDIYLQVGGLDEEAFKVALNDVDFCLKVRAAGYRNVFTPHAQLYHHESASRGYEDSPEKRERFRVEVERLQKKWGDALMNDPAYNPNLTLENVDHGLAFPPRATPAWRKG